MIDFSLSEEQQQLQGLAREFAEKEIVPNAAHHDETGEFPRAICQKAWDLGLMNTHIPAEYGGAGLGVVDGCILAEEIARGCTGIGTAMEANTLAEGPIIVGASDEQKRRILTPMTEKFGLAAYCVTEPQAGSDVAGMKTTARKVGDDYVLKGQKMWITNGSTADWYFVVAYTDESQKHRGMSAFYVPRDTPGIEVGKKEKNMGQRCSDTRAITFNDVKVPKQDLIGAEGKGWMLAMAAFDHSRPIVAAAAVGLARSAMEHAVRYSKERTAFGVPIATKQAIAFMLSNMAIEIDAMRLLAWEAAWRLDNGLPAVREAYLAKQYAADAVLKIADNAVQVLGGHGYIRDHPVEMWLRNARGFASFEGMAIV